MLEIKSSTKRHLTEMGRKALAILLTFSMVSQTSPLAYAVGTAEGEQPTSEVVEPQATSDEAAGTTSGAGAAAVEEVAPAAEPEAQPEAQPEATPEAQPEATTDATSETQPDTTPGQQPEATPETTSGQQPGTTPVAELSPEVIVPDQVEAGDEVSLGLSFEHAYITILNQTVAAPANSIDIPSAADLRFAASADAGYKLAEVRLANGEATRVLEPDGDGLYLISKEYAVPGTVLTVRAEATSAAQPVPEATAITAVNDQTEFQYKDDDVIVTAHLTDPTAVPADVRFQVTHVTPESDKYDYDAYMQALNDSTDEEGKEYTTENTLLYDVAFLVPKTDDEGQAIEGEWVEVQLEKGLVNLEFQFLKNQLGQGIKTENSEDVEIKHLPLKDSVRGDVNTTADATSISPDDVIVENPKDTKVNVDAEQMNVTLEDLSLVSVANTKKVSAGDVAPNVTANEQSVFIYDDDDVTVTATLTDPTSLPAGVQFRVTPIGPQTEGYNYDAYLQALNDNASDGQTYTPENTFVYDVAFLVPKTAEDGTPIEGEWVEVQLSEGQVHIDFQFKKAQLSQSVEEAEAATEKTSGKAEVTEIEINHLPLVDSVREQVDTTADATDISASDIRVEAPLTQEVDIEGESMSVSLDSLSVITGTVRTTASGEPTPGEPTTDETTTSTSHEIRKSTNLANFLTSAYFDAPMNSAGQYVISPGASYNFTLVFRERYNDGDTLQFDDKSVMTYTLPAGLQVDGHEGEFTIKIKDGTETYSITGNTYQIQNGVLSVRFNQNHQYFNKLTATANTQFSLQFEGKFAENVDKILFSDSIEKDLSIDTSSSVTSSKSARFDKASNQIVYTVGIRSTGTSTKVIVKDTITGSALVLDPLSIRATSSKGGTVNMTGSAQGNSFRYEIPSMSNGEVITFTYRANVDVSSIQAVNGKYVTTGNNSVEVTSHEDPTPHTSNVSNTIDYTPSITKSNGVVTAENGNKKTMTWTIEANKEAKVSMAGTTITDKIAQNSRDIMKYSGNGLNIVVKDASGTVVRTDNVAWNSSSITNKTDSEWTYTVPGSDSGKAYSYTITYTTEVDLTGKTSVTTVDNDVTTSGGGSSHGSGQGTPAGGEVKVYKSVSDINMTDKVVTWNVSFNVPEGGLTQAEVVDSYPNQWNDDKHFVEEAIEGSVRVTGLVSGESYDVTYGSANANIVFYQDAAKQIPGLKAAGARTINVELKTEIDQDWLRESATESGKWLNDWHINNVRLTANGEAKTASAKAVYSLPQVDKQMSPQGTRNINGVDLPIYKFDIIVTGVTYDDLEIVDTFDTELLQYYTGSEFGDNGKVYGGTSIYWPQDASNTFNRLDTANGMIITTNSACLPHDATNPSGYYAGYRFTYYLMVKNQGALEKIKSRAAAAYDGKYTMSNVASFSDATDGAEITYEYQGLKKELLTPDSELKKTDEDIWATFKITLNSGGMVLNGGNPLTMTDTVENLSVDITSIQATPSTGVSWDMTGNTVTYTIPDATHVEIIYNARVIMSTLADVGQTQHINFSNHAVMKGYDETISGTAERHNKGEGTGSIPQIRLKKYRAGDMTQTLAGARFQLQDASGNPILDKNGHAVEFTTGDDGMITIVGDMEKYGWALKDNTLYNLEEVEAPQGYMLTANNNSKYQFKISSDGTSDYSQHIYFSGDTMSVKNYPGTDVRVLKEWSDGNDHHEDDEVVVKLQQKVGGTWSDAIRRKKDDGTWEELSSWTITLNKDSNWQGSFNKLPLAVPQDINNPDGKDVAVDYKVVEVSVNDEPAPDSVEISGGKGENSGTYIYTIENKVDTGELEVTKTVNSPFETDSDVDFTFTVTLGDTTVNGEYGDMNFEDGSATFTLKDGEKATADGLPTDITYTVVETANNDFTTTKTGDEGTISTTKATAAFTNTRNTGDLKLTKAFVSNAAADAGAEFTFTVTLDQMVKAGTYGGMTFTTSEDSKSVATVVLSEEKGWTATATGLPADIGYTITEDASTDDNIKLTGITVNGTKVEGEQKAEGTITANSEQAVVFTNTRDTGDLELSKQLVANGADTTGDTFTFNVKVEGLADTTKSYDLYDDETKVGDVKFNNQGETTVTFTGTQTRIIKGLPVGVTYTVSEAPGADYDAELVAAKTNATPVTEGVTVPTATGTIGSELSKVTIKNTRKVADISLGKQVNSAGTDLSKLFTFVVSVWGVDADATFDVMRPAETAGAQATRIGTAKFNAQGTATFTPSGTPSSNIELSGSTIKLSHGERVIIEGLPVGVRYEVNEQFTDADVENFVTTWAGETSTNLTVNGAEITATNIRNAGGLVVTKTVDSPFDADKAASKTFTFTVTLEDGTITGDYPTTVSGEGITATEGETTHFDSGVATFSLANGQTRTITDLPDGMGYTVTETVDDDFETKVGTTTLAVTQGDTGKVMEGVSGNIDVDETSIVEFVNERRLGDLELSKQLVANGADTSDDTFTFQVVITEGELPSDTYAVEYVGSDALPTTVKFVDKTANVTVPAGGKATIKGLPAGVKYTVSEAPGADYDAALVKSDGQTTGTEVTEGVTAPTATGTIGSAPSKVTIKNTRKVGDLTLKKTVESQDVADATKGFAFNVKVDGLASATRTFGLYDGDTKLQDITFDAQGEATVTLADGQTRTIKGLPAGVTYTVSEAPGDDYDAELVAGETTGTEVTEGVGGPTATGTIGSELSKVTIKNTRKVGKLELEKLVESNTQGDHAATYRFTVELAGKLKKDTYSGHTFTYDKGTSTTTVDIVEGANVVIDGLPVGMAYTVRETAPDGFVANLSEANGFIAEADAQSNAVSKATITNTRTQGDLSVTKQVLNGVGNDLERTFTIKVTLYTGDPAGKTPEELEALRAVDVNGTYDATPDTAPDADATPDATSDATSGTVSMGNFVDGVATFELANGQTATANGLPKDLYYIVEETGAPAGEGTIGTLGDFEATYTNRSGRIGATEQTAAVTVKNTRRTGDLKLVKTLDAKGADDAGRVFTFRVELDQAVGGPFVVENGVPNQREITFDAATRTADVFVPAGATGVTIKGLPVGVGYKVYEVAQDNYTTEFVTENVVHGKATGAISSTDTSVVEIKNTRETGRLTLSKRLVSDWVADDAQEFEFAVRVTGLEAASANSDVSKAYYVKVPAAVEGEADSTIGTVTFAVTKDANTNGASTFTIGSESSGTIKLKDGDRVYIDGLPVGVSYEVTEVDVPGFEFKGRTAASDSLTGTIAAATTVELENKRTTGDLTVTKTVDTEQKSDWNTKEFTFDITLYGQLEKTEYGDMEFAYDAEAKTSTASVTLRHGQHATASGLPTGMRYVVTEQVAGGWTVVKSGKTGEAGNTATITAGDTNVAQFTNTALGGLIVQKRVESELSGDKTTKYTIKVTMSPEIVADKTFGDMHFDEDGVATLTLADDEYAQASGLPLGAAYTVSEVEPNGFVRTYEKTIGVTTAAENADAITGTIGEAATTVTVVNTRDVAPLTITKQVSSDRAADDDLGFQFTIRMFEDVAHAKPATLVSSLLHADDSDYYGTYGASATPISFNGGVATVTLKGGETADLKNLPVGVHYTVTEAENSGFIAMDGLTSASGQVVAAANEETLTNVRKTAGITLSKTVESDASADHSRKFGFTVTVPGLDAASDDTPGVSKAYDVVVPAAAEGEAGTAIGTVTFAVTDNPETDGVATFTAGSVTSGNIELSGGTIKLSDGDTVRIEGLPTGVAYTVAEVEDGGFTTVANGETGTSLPAGGATAAFANTRVTGGLKVSKSVVSATPTDRTTQFSFKITLVGLKAPEATPDTTVGEPATKTYGDLEFTYDNVAKTYISEFTLSDADEAKSVTGLPVGTGYVVEETDEATGFKKEVRANIEDDIAIEEPAKAEGTVVVDKTPEITFTNTRDEGGFTVSKHVVDATDKNATTKFNFTVTIEDELVVEAARKAAESGEALEYGEMAFSYVRGDGETDAGKAVAEFSLADDEEITASGLPVGVSYTVSEDGVPGFTASVIGAQGTKNDDGSYSATAKITKSADGEYPELAFTNTYSASGSTSFKVAKVLTGRSFEDGDTWKFTLSSDDSDAPLPPEDERTVTINPLSDKAADPSLDLGDNSNHEYFSFGQIEYSLKDAGKTYTYRITEEDVVEGGINNVRNDTVHEVEVSIEDKGNGELDVKNEYKVKPAVFTNDYLVKVPLEAKKVIDGRDWKTGVNGLVDEDFTFQLYAGGYGDDPEVLKELRDRSEAKLEESGITKTTKATRVTPTVTFGELVFTKDDLGKTFAYTVKEVIPEGVPYDTETKEHTKDGLTYDEFEHYITIEIVESEGKLKAEVRHESYDKEKGEIALEDGNETRIHNRYEAKPAEAYITATKSMGGTATGREPEPGTFRFELRKANADSSLISPSDKLHGDPIVNGYQFDADGQYAPGGDASQVNFEKQTYLEEGVFEYTIREVVPNDAVATIGGVTYAYGTAASQGVTWEQASAAEWKKDGITYDTTVHKVKVTVTDNKVGALIATVVYDDDPAAEPPVFTNTYYSAQAEVHFAKEFYGTDRGARFGFMLTGADESFEPRAAKPGGDTTEKATKFDDEHPLIDDGEALKVMFTNELFDGDKVDVALPSITYHEAGKYYYVISELGRIDGDWNVVDDAAIQNDSAQLLVTVEVAEDATTKVSYAMRADGVVTPVSGDDVAFYNNGMVAMAFRSRALAALDDMDRVASFEPKVRKVLKQGFLSDGQFEFALYEGSEASGTPLLTGKNDANGNVAFGALNFHSEDAGKPFTYTIVEIPGTDSSINYSDEPITLTVNVRNGENGALVVEGTYEQRNEAGELVKTEDPTIINSYDTIVIHAVKRTREFNEDGTINNEAEGLADAHYGLWMVNPNGEDVYMGLGRNQLEVEGSELKSSENGDLYYDIPLLEGVAYYFLEEAPPPAGHLVDPYPTDYFTLVHDESGFRLVYEHDEFEEGKSFASYVPTYNGFSLN